MGKKVISGILMETRDWKDASKVKPNRGQCVVIRMTNPDMIFSENENEIYPSEDEKIAEWIPGADPKNGLWRILPPYPLFDYSPLSHKESLNEGTIVTHWAEPEEGEFDRWCHRFDQFNIYKKLHLEVDEDHLEAVYRALIWGAAYIHRANPNDADAQRLVNILYDLQYILDTGKNIDLTDEEYERQIEERRAEIEKKKQEMEKKRQERIEAEIEKMEGERNAVGK